MSETAIALLAQLAELAPVERYEVAYRLLETLAGEDDPAWDSAWAVEIRSRTEMLDHGSATEERADEVISELRKKHA